MRLSQIRASALLLVATATAGIVLIVVAAVLDVSSARSERSQERSSSRLDELIRAQLHVEKLLLDLETGQRGYLLTSQQAFLEPYRTARADLPGELARVERLAAPHPEQAAGAQRLRTLVEAKLQQADETIRIDRTRGPAAAQALVRTGRGRLIMDDVRSVIERSATAGELESARLAAEARTVSARAGRVRAFAAGSVIVLFGLVLWLVRQRERAEARRRADDSVKEALLADLAHQAVHDTLTGLPNRRLLEDRMAQALARTARDGTLLAILFVDLDRFKHINDRYGHGVGDRVLVATAERLTAMLRSTDTLARVGGDEFVVLCEELPDSSAALTLVASVQEALAFRLDAEDVLIDISASVGVAVADHQGIRLTDLDTVAPSDGPIDAEAVLAAADEAMYSAKDLGRARSQAYGSELARSRRHRVALAGDLHEALHGDPVVGGRMWVAFQPLVRLDTAQPVGVEALCRWTHPTQGEISPADFIPVAESAGLVGALGDLVLETACTQVTHWNGLREERGLPPLYVSVNCSARQLLHPGYTDRLAQILGETGTAPGSLVIELTESVLVDTVTGAAARLQSLSDMGVRLALDDFGTGYSSLAYLRRFPFDLLKIDRSFAAGLGQDGDDEAIVASVVTMAAALHRTLIVEGIETSAQASNALRLGCAFAQGYHFGRPGPAASLRDTLVPASPPDGPVEPAVPSVGSEGRSRA